MQNQNKVNHIESRHWFIELAFHLTALFLLCVITVKSIFYKTNSIQQKTDRGIFIMIENFPYEMFFQYREYSNSGKKRRDCVSTDRFFCKKLKNSFNEIKQNKHKESIEAKIAWPIKRVNIRDLAHVSIILFSLRRTIFRISKRYRRKKLCFSLSDNFKCFGNLMNIQLLLPWLFFMNTCVHSRIWNMCRHWICYQKIIYCNHTTGDANVWLWLN